VPTRDGSTRWRLHSSDAGLRMSPVRAFGSDVFDWGDLLRARLATAQVYVIYFPSRFQLPVDTIATDTLRVFGANTSIATSVNVWDPTDGHFSAALGLFGLRQPPALVLVTGLRERDPDDDPASSLYCLSFAAESVLADPARMASAVNIAHEILTRCDPKEIAGYVRARRVSSILRLIGRGTGAIMDEFVRLHPKLGLPGGVSVELG
jgi:hypothetical protein